MVQYQRYGLGAAPCWVLGTPSMCSQSLVSARTARVIWVLKKGPSALTVNRVCFEGLACSTVPETERNVEKEVYLSLYLAKFMKFGWFDTEWPCTKIIIFCKIVLLLLLTIPAADCVGLSTHPSLWKCIMTLLETFSEQLPVQITILPHTWLTTCLHLRNIINGLSFKKKTLLTC